MTKEGLNTALNVLCLAAQQCQHAVQVVSPFMIFCYFRRVTFNMSSLTCDAYTAVLYVYICCFITTVSVFHIIMVTHTGVNF